MILWGKFTLLVLSSLCIKIASCESSSTQNTARGIALPDSVLRHILLTETDLHIHRLGNVRPRLLCFPASSYNYTNAQYSYYSLFTSHTSRLAIFKVV